MLEKRLIPVNGLKKEPFSGCHSGMRYYFLYDKKVDEDNFTVYIYPDPWSFEKTPEEEKISAAFPVTEEGMDQAMAWLQEQFDAQKDKWIKAAADCMRV